MNRELIINVTPCEISIALLEDKLLVELNKEKCKTQFSVGDIYLGTVKKTLPGLNAAFVNIGSEKDAFIHYLDLGPHFNSLQYLAKNAAKKEGEIKFEELKSTPIIKKDGKIAQTVNAGDPIIVQVAKEAISTKGPRLTSDISIAGRTVVLMPFSTKISISQKIKSTTEKRRLKTIAESVLPNNYGIIIRTAAMNKDSGELETEIKSLVEKWKGVLNRLKTGKAPTLLASEMNRTTAILRDLLNGSFSNIDVDDETVYDEVKTYIRTIEPEKEKIVKLYKGSVPIFDNFDITKQIKSSFGKTISYKKGAYLIIEHTEALHVIDVNSGKRAKISNNQEETAIEVNMNAVPEIARQLRLRDMGGIIVIDFIDMHIGANRQQLFDAMKAAMAQDRAKHNVLPLSKFGVMQITRQRVRPETKIEITECCPTCRGTGKIAPTIFLDKQIENQITYLTTEKGCKYINLHVNKFTAAFLKKGFIPLYWKWMWRYKCRIQVVPDISLGYIETKFLDRELNVLI